MARNRNLAQRRKDLLGQGRIVVGHGRRGIDDEERRRAGALRDRFGGPAHALMDVVAHGGIESADRPDHDGAIGNDVVAHASVDRADRDDRRRHGQIDLAAGDRLQAEDDLRRHHDRIDPRPGERAMGLATAHDDAEGIGARHGAPRAVADLARGIGEHVQPEDRTGLRIIERAFFDHHLGAAAVMIEEGALDDPKPSAIFGLHVFPYPAGEIRYRPGGAMASADAFRIVVRGRQTHGALPWAGIDPIVVASQIVLGLQTITSRQVDLTVAPAIVTVGAINGGVRYNIIPDSAVMIGTIRTFDTAVRNDIHQRVRRTAESIAQSAGATALVVIDTTTAVTYNDPALTEKILPTLRQVAVPSHVALGPPITAAEDFSRYQQRIPGVFFFLGITPPGTDPAKAAPNHSPRFYVDEAAFPVGVRAMAHLAVDYLSRGR